MYWNGAVTAGIMLRDGGQQECCSLSFCILLSEMFNRHFSHIRIRKWGDIV